MQAEVDASQRRDADAALKTNLFIGFTAIPRCSFLLFIAPFQPFARHRKAFFISCFRQAQIYCRRKCTFEFPAVFPISTSSRAFYQHENAAECLSSRLQTPETYILQVPAYQLNKQVTNPSIPIKVQNAYSL